MNNSNSALYTFKRCVLHYQRVLGNNSFTNRLIDDIYYLVSNSVLEVENTLFGIYGIGQLLFREGKRPRSCAEALL